MLTIIDTLTNTTHSIDTPFGTIPYQQAEHLAVLPITQLPSSPISDYYYSPALAYAAKAIGATQVLAIIRDTAVSTPTTPNDFIEFTNGRFTTFFNKIGTGFIQQTPPFCPELRQALINNVAKDGNTILIRDTQPNPTEREWWHKKGIKMLTTHSQPEGALCRELEICFAVLAVPQTFNLSDWLPQLLAHISIKRTCECGNTMTFSRKIGKLPNDWQMYDWEGWYS